MLNKGLYEQVKQNSFNKPQYERGSFSIQWMRPILWRFTSLGKKTLRLMKRLKSRKNGK